MSPAEQMAFVAGAYGVAALALVGLIAWSWLRLRRWAQEARKEEGGR